MVSEILKLTNFQKLVLVTAVIGGLTIGITSGSPVKSLFNTVIAIVAMVSILFVLATIGLIKQK